jgi:hypothetical protein
MHHLHYIYAGNQEYAIGFRPADTTRSILIVPPLFDEMNRMRRVLVSAMRDLAQRGVASVMPDLPGCNESLSPLAQQDLDRWRGAISAAAQAFGATHIASIRGGSLVDDGPAMLPHWRLAPAKGSSLLKTMLRTRMAGDKEAGITSSMESLLNKGQREPIELAGNIIGPAMIASLEASDPTELNQLTLAAFGSDADSVSGSALWLRAEPQDDAAMAASLAEHLDRWSASCGG